MKTKKIPLRRCVVTNETLPKKELIRIVKDNQGKIFIDLTSKANGHGAYIKKDVQAIEKAKKNKTLSKIFACEVDESIYQDLINFVTKN